MFTFPDIFAPGNQTSARLNGRRWDCVYLTSKYATLSLHCYRAGMCRTLQNSCAGKPGTVNGGGAIQKPAERRTSPGGSGPTKPERYYILGTSHAPSYKCINTRRRRNYAEPALLPK